MSSSAIKKIKVANETAIPTGTYTVDVKSISPRFKNRSWAKPYGGVVPGLVNVPGFSGIRIHPGTDATWSSGCILVGKNTIVGKLTDSTNTYLTLMDKLVATDENITITIQ